MSCQNALSLVPSYLDGELSEEQAAPLRTHLLDCPGCREAVKRDTATKRWFEESVADESVEVPEGFAARVARRAFAGDLGVLVPQARPRARSGSQPAGVLLPFVLKVSAVAAGLLFVFSLGIRMTSLPSDRKADALDIPPWERQDFPAGWVDDEPGGDPDEEPGGRRMSSERLWVLILAATSFLAGGAGGLLLSLHDRPLDPPGQYQAYEQRFVRDYDLDEQQAEYLHGILESYDADVEELKSRHLRDLEPELVALGETCRKRIRRWVVPEDRRADFDRHVSGLALPPENRTE